MAAVSSCIPSSSVDISAGTKWPATKRPALLVLGAGLMQRPAIEAAKSLGCSVVLVDGNPHALCVPEADTFVHLDLKDREGIKELALALRSQGALQGVFTAGTDFSSTVSYVGEACGFSVHSYRAACNASHKALMRGCFKAAGVPSPEFAEVPSSVPTLNAIPESLLRNYPLVVKPVDNMGGRGCRLVHDRQGLLEAVQDAQSNSRSGRAIVEEYMEGPEFSIDALVYNGTVTICGFADRHICFPPYFVEMGHTIPTAASPADQLALIATFVEGIHALGLTCGAAKADIKLTPKGPMVGEIAARLSGGYMSGWTFPHSSGFFLTQQAAAIALGREPAELLKRRHLVAGLPQMLPFTVYQVESTAYCAERAWVSIPGTVAAVHGLDRAGQCPGVRDVLPRSTAGDKVVFPRNNVEKCGNILAVDATYQGAADKAQAAVKSLVIQLEPNRAETDAFLSVPLTQLRQGTSFPPAAFVLPPPLEQEFARYLSSRQGDFNPEQRLLEQIPSCLRPYLNSLFDWNYRSLEETVLLAQEVLGAKVATATSCGAAISLARLWHSCILGGVQGLLYVIESSCQEK